MPLFLMILTLPLVLLGAYSAINVLPIVYDRLELAKADKQLTDATESILNDKPIESQKDKTPLAIEHASAAEETARFAERLEGSVYAKDKPVFEILKTNTSLVARLSDFQLNVEASHDLTVLAEELVSSSLLYESLVLTDKLSSEVRESYFEQLQLIQSMLSTIDNNYAEGLSRKLLTSGEFLKMKFQSEGEELDDRMTA